MTYKKALSHERAFFISCSLGKKKDILRQKKGKSHDFHNSSNLKSKSL